MDDALNGGAPEGFQMTDKAQQCGRHANKSLYESFKERRWTDETLIAYGYMSAVQPSLHLPPLPVAWITDGTAKDPESRHHYAEDQMTDYALAAVAAAQVLPVGSADLGKLKALAEAATPGEWMRLFGERTVYDRMEDGCRGKAIVRADVGWSSQDGCNLDFIAAANPAAILRIAALVAQQAARIEELTSALAAARDLHISTLRTPVHFNAMPDLIDKALADWTECDPDEPTEREQLIACLGDDAAKLIAQNPDDEMAQTMRDAAAMLEATSEQMGGAQVASELETALTVFDMGLSFALCHRDFGSTRAAIKKLQANFEAIRAMIAAPTTERAVEEQATERKPLTDADYQKILEPVLSLAGVRRYLNGDPIELYPGHIQSIVTRAIEHHDIGSDK